MADSRARRGEEAEATAVALDPVAATVRRAVTVVVPTRDRPDHLDGCLASLATALDRTDEVIVVDSASRTPATAAVAARYDARLVQASRPGASRARNLGWQHATHELVAFVDDDVRVSPQWADRLVAALTSSAASFVTGRVEVPPAQAGAERPVAVTTLTEPTRIDAATGGAFGASCNLLVRRSALVEIGGFDEELGPGTWSSAAEDLDLFDRLIASGHVGWFSPDALAHHEQWRSRRELLRLDWGYGKGAGVRLVRVARHDRRRAAGLVRQDVWHGGLRALLGDLAGGYQFGVLTVTVRLAGMAVGVLRALLGAERAGRDHHAGRDHRTGRDTLDIDLRDRDHDDAPSRKAPR